MALFSISFLQPLFLQSDAFSESNDLFAFTPAVATKSVELEPTKTPFQTPQTSNNYCLYAPVLLYHHIQPLQMALEKKQLSLSVDSAIFEQQMEYLVQSGYKAISAEELVIAVRNHTLLPQKSIVITLDDGYLDAFTYAYPIFKKYNMHFNLMLVAGLVGGNDYLSWSQVDEMAQSGLMHISNHTWSHAAVGQIADDVVVSEIKKAQEDLQKHSPERITIFTYPYGSFSNSAIRSLEKQGFSGAFATIPGMLQCESFIMTLHRTHIGNFPLSSLSL